MPTKKIAVSRKRTAIEEEGLRVAPDKFGKQGYQATTLDEIAAEAGISRAAFYLYFPSKEDSAPDVSPGYCHGPSGNRADCR